MKGRGERRAQVAVRMSAEGIAALDARVAAVGERTGVVVSRSDVVRWLVAEANGRLEQGWVPRGATRGVGAGLDTND